MALPVSDEISLDLTPGKVMPVVNVSQFDKGRVIKVNLTNNGVPYIVRNTDSFVINVRKPDGTIVTSSCGPGSISGIVYTYIYFTTSVQMAAVAGDSLCEIKITDSEDSSEDPNVIGTLNFILRVEKDPIDGGVQSASAIHDLEEQIEHALSDMSLDDLGDVEINEQTLAMNQALMYDAVTGTWKNVYTALGKLLDVTITNPQNGDVIGYDSASESWMNMQGGGGGGSSTLEGLSDVNLSQAVGRARGQSLILEEDANHNKYWTNKAKTIELYTVLFAGETEASVTYTGSSILDLRDEYEDDPQIYTSIKGVAPYSEEWSSDGRTYTMKFIPQEENLQINVVFSLHGALY